MIATSVIIVLREWDERPMGVTPVSPTPVITWCTARNGCDDASTAAPQRAALLWLGVVSRGPTSSMVGGMIAGRSASID
jgi:hypothetical protein